MTDITREEHDRRVTELLDHNNKLEGRARAAERKARFYSDILPVVLDGIANMHALKSSPSEIRNWLRTQIGEIPAQAREYNSAQACLDKIAAIIEGVDDRALAADGPVTPTPQEMSIEEFQKIYGLAKAGDENWRPA